MPRDRLLLALLIILIACVVGIGFSPLGFILLVLLLLLLV